VISAVNKKWQNYRKLQQKVDSAIGTFGSTDFESTKPPKSQSFSETAETKNYDVTNTEAQIKIDNSTVRTLG
jgi:hypothetical protein